MANNNLGKAVMWHYTNMAAWKGANEGNPGYSYQDTRTGKYVDGKDVRGLWPSRRLIAHGVESRLVPSEATQPAVFGLPEEQPESWVKYEDCINVFDYLMSCCSGCSEGKKPLVLLRVDLQPEDKPLVVDYLHIRNLARAFNDEQDLCKKMKISAEGNKNYWESRVPLADYKGGFTLPEIVVFAPLPLERVHFVWEKDTESFLDEAHALVGSRRLSF